MSAIQEPAQGVLYLHLLGSPQLLCGSMPLALETAKARALLFYLAVTGQRCRREVLVDLLWGEMAEAAARRNLTATLTSLRRELAPYLLVEPDEIAFNPAAPHFVDVLRFRQLLAAGRAANDLAQVREAVALYRGDFLAGFTVKNATTFEEWAAAQREQLREQMLLALQLLLDEAVVRADYASGLDYANQLLAMDPWREIAHRQLMVLHAQSGRRDAALAQFELCRRILVEELGVDPMPETLALHARLLAADAPPAHNLPPQPNYFVGRTSELRQINEHLADDACRLLTIVGPGGIGKTRLALEAARHFTTPDRLLSPVNFVDGVYFVSLAGIAGAARPGAGGYQADALLGAIAEAVSVNFEGGADGRRYLLNFLRPKTLLLILDNFEHLLGNETPLPALDLVEALLRQAPNVKILVTSRERLNLQEEWVLEVAGLDYPPAGAPAGQPPVSLAAINRYDAVALFVQRASQTRTGFTLAEEEMPAVVRLCQLLAGMPLGLELAATWLRDLSCAEVVAELERGMDFLATTLRNPPARHRSLRAVFDHSWQILSEQEQAILRKLSIFQGSFSREAAGAVAGASLPMLARLADKSLLRRSTDPGGRVRYDLHEMVRQFAAEKLRADPAEEAQVQATHARYFADFLCAFEPDFLNERQTQAYTRMCEEIHNITAAWETACQQPPDADGVDTVQKFINSLGNFYTIHSQLIQGEAFAEKAVAYLRRADPADPVVQTILAKALTWQSIFQLALDKTAQAESNLAESYHLAQQAEAPEQLASALGWQAIIARKKQDFGHMQQLAAQGLTIARQAQLWHLEARMLSHLANAALGMGAYTEARERIQQSLQMYLDHNHLFYVDITRGTLATISGRLGDFDEAKQQWLQVLALQERMGSSHRRHALYVHLGAISQALGECDAARRYYSESIRFCQEVGLETQEAYGLAGLGDLARLLGEYTEAGYYLEQSRQRFQAAGWSQDVAETLYRLGQVALATDDLAAAQQYFADSYALYQPSDNRSGMALAQKGTGQVAQAAAQPEEARRHFCAALQTLQGLEAYPILLDVLTQLAATYLTQDGASRGLLLLAYLRQQTRVTSEVRGQAGDLWNLYRDQIAQPMLTEAVTQAQGSTLAQVIAAAIGDDETAKLLMQYAPELKTENEGYGIMG